LLTIDSPANETIRVIIEEISDAFFDPLSLLTANKASPLNKGIKISKTGIIFSLKFYK